MKGDGLRQGRGKRAALALLVALALVPALAGVAAAAQQAPPGWQDPGNNGWVAFTLDPRDPAPDSRTTYAPVNLIRSTNLSGDDLRNAFNNWEALPDGNNDGQPDGYRWPLVWEDPSTGLSLQRVDQCDWTESQCRYAMDGADSGKPFWYFGGTPPPDPNNPNATDPDPNTYNQGTITLPPPPDIHYTMHDEETTENGKIRLSAAGTHDDAPGSLTYEWVLSSASGKTYAGTGEIAEFSVNENGQYCVQLTVTNTQDNYKKSSSGCSGASGGEFIFSYNGYTAPAPPSGGGGTKPPPPSGGGGGTGGGGGGFGSGIVFSRPARAPAALSGGGSPTVIWLWRPEWYQAEPESAEPETSGRPNLHGRRDIVVRSPGREGASAGPWLAGLVAFGIFGGRLLYKRRAQLRTITDY